jgi:VWFA-related protein
MVRILPSLALIVVLGPAGPPLQAPAERSSRLLIDAVAFDRNGAPVVDLKPEELEVWIGHFRVPIESLAAVTPASDAHGGRLTVLVLDDMTLPLTLAGRAQDVARRFVNRMLPGDRMAIVSLDGSAMELTDDRTRLFRTVDAFGVRSGGLMPMDRLGEHVLKTIGALSRQMVEAPRLGSGQAGGQRKTIVAIGSGWLFDRPIPPPAAGMDPRREWIAAMQAMALSNVNLYVIDPAGMSTVRADSGGTGFARETGGFAFVATNDLNGAADRIMREAANYYLIGVGDPPVGRGADLRELDVKVLRRGVSVRARRTVTGGS